MFLLLACGLGGCDYAKDLPMLGRYVAKNVCASIWQEGYDQSAAIGYVTNVAPLVQPSWKVLLGDRSVQVDNFWFPWLASKQASVVGTEAPREDCRNHYLDRQLAYYYALPPAPSSGFVTQVDPTSALQRYVQSVVAVGAPEHSTAILVLKGNTVVAEAYRDGLGPDSPLKGFSMSKSFANLLLGRLVGRGAVHQDDAMLLAGWEQDQRALISYDHSLRMNSGLQWHEASLGANNDQGQMLYNSADPAGYAASKPYAQDPEQEFNYSSGDYMNLASALVRLDDWFDPGWDLESAFHMEFSPNGATPLLGEGVYLTTRGWAALASIYMHGGELNGHAILTPDWVNYSLTPGATNYDYGAGIWLNLGQNLFPELPPDAFAFAGSYDRYVVAVPQADVVVVRMGFSTQPDDFKMGRFVSNVLELVPQQ
ncbi:MAG: serine hydrolase [Pseudomonadota bacterium]|nr:serine hydrolase [Pseudomonadota bacterium]